jgi:hypothetical protein
VKSRHFLPLLGFVLPTLAIGYGIVILRSCIAGINAQSVGFGSTVLGGLSYLTGIRLASEDRPASYGATTRWGVLSSSLGGWR